MDNLTDTCCEIDTCSETEEMSNFDLYDADGDGYVDTAITDLDGDGYDDYVIGDLDGNGWVDFEALDVDGDSAPDVVAFDHDEDGVFDEVWTNETFDAMTSTEPGVLDDDPDVHGAPMAAIDYHQVQQGAYDCGPTSVAMVLTEITGQSIDANSVVDAAWDMGLMHETGMAPTECEALLESYGVDAELQQGDVDSLRTALDDGRQIIVTLDSDDLNGNGDAPFADDLVSGHAVVITGIDDEAGLVYINDPGFSDGAGVAIPIEQFEDAWADFDNQMIVTQEGDLSSDPADDHSILDIILLPLTFIVGK